MDSSLLQFNYSENPFADVVPKWLLSRFTIDAFYNLRPQLVVAALLILTTSVILKISRNSDNNVESLVRPILSAFIITLVAAAAPYWMQLAWKGFIEIAKGPLEWSKNKKIVDIVAGLAAFLAAAIPKDMDSMTKMTGTSLVTSLSAGAGAVVAQGAMLIQKMLFILQYVMLQICYVISPVAIACYGLDSTKDLANKFVLQTLSLMSWIIGFAIVNIIAMKLMVYLLPSFAAGAAATIAASLLDFKVDFSKPIAMYSFVISSWIMGGTAMVPIFMQGLFTSGMAAAGQAFHPSMAGINGINVAKGQAGGQGMMPGPGGSMMPLPGGNTSALGARAGTMQAQQANRAATSAALNSSSGGTSNIQQSAFNNSTTHVASKSSTSNPALSNSAQAPMGNNMDNMAAVAQSSGSGTGSANSPSNPINQAAFAGAPATPASAVGSTSGAALGAT